MSLSAVNDFVVKFANVNGSGSASANGMFAKSILRMGVPVAARNIFPSNIQGLPTWYEVRISEAGHLGRRGDVDIMGIPLTAICNAAYTDPRQRQLFKNIIYLGALTHLLSIEQEVLE